MRKNISLLLIFISILALSACTNGPLFIKDSDKRYGFDDLDAPINEGEEIELSENKEIPFVLRKINYLKDLEVQNDRVEIDKNDSSLLSMVIKPCLTDDIELSSLVYKNGKFHILLNSKNDSNNVCTPYISIKLLNKLPDDIEADDFVIDKSGIKNIDIKYTKDNAINYVKQKYKLIANLPDSAELIYTDRPIWQIKYKFVYEKDDHEHPIKNLKINFDANEGKVLSLDEEIISKFIDNGNVFKLNTDKAIYYNKKVDELNNIYIYDIASRSSKKILSFSGDIKSIYKRNENDDIIINFKDKSSALSSAIYNEEKDEIKFIDYRDDLNIIDANFKSDDSLLAISRGEANMTTLYEVDINDDSYIDLFSAEDNIIRASYINGFYVYLSKYDINQMLYITRDFEDYDFIDEVENYYYADDNSFVYRIDNKIEGTSLYTYNLSERFYKMIIKGDYSYIKKIDEAYVLAKKDINLESYDLLLCKLDNNLKEEVLFENVDNLSLYLTNDLKKLYKSTKVIDKNYTKNIIYEIDISKGDA